MFQELEALVRSAGRLTLTIQMAGERMSVFAVPQGDSKEAALRQPLIVSGSALELDEGFVTAVRSYTEQHRSLEEQVAATTAILENATKAQAGKAHKVLSKVSAKSPRASSSDRDSDDDQDADDTSVNESSPAAPATVASTGTDLLSLLDK